MELTTLILSIVAIVLGIATLVAVLVLLRRAQAPAQDEEVLQRVLRARLEEATNALLRQVDTYMRASAQQAELAETRQTNQERHTLEQLDAIQTKLQLQWQAQREELARTLESMRGAIDAKQLQTITLTQTRLDELRQEVTSQLSALREENNKQLDRVRHVVDVQLQENLQNHLTQSFAVITENLQKVYTGLGEMQALTAGMNDLRKVLSGVKTRGIWGEASLAGLLAEILTPEQYDTNVRTAARGDRSEVEFAVKLPGSGEGTVYMPIDSKFPKEDYERLVAAAEEGNREAMEAAIKALEVRIKSEAKDISTKYIHPPRTTDFAVMYLPIEGLYAEVVRRPALVESLRTSYKVMVAGPTTLAALLNSLQVGFRTLAVEKRSKEIWNLFATIQRLFGQFAKELASAEQLAERVTKTIHATGLRSRRIEDKLRDVQQLTDAEVDESLLVSADDTEGDSE